MSGFDFSSLVFLSLPWSSLRISALFSASGLSLFSQSTSKASSASSSAFFCWFPETVRSQSLLKSSDLLFQDGTIHTSSGFPDEQNRVNCSSDLGSQVQLTLSQAAWTCFSASTGTGWRSLPWSQYPAGISPPARVDTDPCLWAPWWTSAVCSRRLTEWSQYLRRKHQAALLQRSGPRLVSAPHRLRVLTWWSKFRQ